MLKLELQYFGHLMQRVDSLEKTLMLGGIGGRRKGNDSGWDGRMASPTWWTWVWVNSGSWWWTRRPGVLQFMGSQRVGHDELLNWLILVNCNTTYQKTEVQGEMKTASPQRNEFIIVCPLATIFHIPFVCKTSLFLTKTHKIPFNQLSMRSKWILS